MNAMFCDLYNFQITGEVSANLNASSCNSPTHSGPTLLVLNDQGGDVMNVSDEVTSTLRAQDHGHPPVVCLNFQGSKSNNVCTDDGICYSMNAMHGHDVHVVCFEPGILSRDCSAGNRAYINICSTLRAQMGDNLPAVCFQQNQREEVRDMGEQAGALTAEPGMHNQNYLCYAIDHVVTTGGGCTAQGPCWYQDVCPTEKAGGVHAVCYAVEGNIVDRASSKNGKGWCENVSPTLNTQDRHAICFQLCGDRDNPSVSTSDTAYCIPANAMSDRGQALCYKK